MSIIRKHILKLIIPIFYAAAVVLMVVFSWNYEKAAHQGFSPLYIDLTESPAYIRRGFDRAELAPENFNQLAADLRLPDSGWVQFHSPPPLLVMESPHAETPRRRFMSPWGKEVQEFTILIPMEVDRGALSFMENKPTVMPGIYLAGIGDN